jgi:hypothetical protein
MITALIGAPPAVAQQPSPVLATPASEMSPAAGGSYLAWTQGRTARPARFNAYAKREGQPKFRLNAPDTHGFTTGGAIDGTMLVYGQRPSLRKPGDLKLFNLLTRTRTDPPAGVNTRRNHEAIGSLSGEWLLFYRETLPTAIEQSARIMLFNLVTREVRQLDIALGRTAVQPGAVRGNYATWIRCARPTRCNAYAYNIVTRAKLRVPNPLRRAQYAVSITAAGVVYFAESKSINCGSALGLWRYPLGGTRTKLLSLPRGRDVSDLSPLVNTDGSTTLFYDRFRCRTDTSDIFKVVLGGS